MLVVIRLGTILLLFRWSAPQLLVMTADNEDNTNDLHQNKTPYLLSPIPHFLNDVKRLIPDLDGKSCPQESLLCQQSIAYEICDALLYYPEQCGPFNATDYLRDRCYCDQVEIIGRMKSNLCCNFKNRVPATHSSMRPAQQTVHLINASVLPLHIDPLTLHELYLFNCHGVNISSDPSTYPPEHMTTFGAVDSSGLDVPWFHIIRLHNSSFTIINGSTSQDYLTEISLVKSSIQTMQLIDLATRVGLDGLGKPDDEKCLKVENTNIYQIFKLHLKCLGHFNGSSVSEIRHFLAESLTMEDSTIETIFPAGLSVYNGTLELSNVRITYLHREAINAYIGGGIYLRNVTLVRCDEPCFVVGKTSLMRFYNTTVNGRRLRGYSDKTILRVTSEKQRLGYSFPIKYSECWPPDEPFVICSGYPDMKKTHEISLASSKKLHVTLDSYSNLRTLEGCHTWLVLNWVNGSYFSARDRHTCGIPLRVTVKNCILTSFVSLKTRIFVATGWTKIDFLYIYNLGHFTASNLRIGRLYSLKYHSKWQPVLDIGHQYFYYTGGSIGVIRNLALLSPSATFSNTTINKIKKMYIAYDGDAPREQLTLIEDSKIGKVDKHGIHVKTGTVMFFNVLFFETSPEMILIDKDGKVILGGWTTELERSCKFDGPLFSAHYRHQVVLLNPLRPAWLFGCIAYRPLHSKCFLSALAPKLPFTSCLDPRSHCTEVTDGSHRCDLSNIKEHIAVGNSQALNDVQQLRIIGAVSLIFGEHCVSEIHLEHSNILYMEPFRWACPLKLKLASSKVQALTRDIWDLVLVNSQADKIELPKASRLKMSHSFVGRLTLSDVLYVRIENSTVNHFKEISVEAYMRVRESDIAVIENLVVREGSSLIIADTTIDHLHRNAITVHGSLVIDNVLLLDFQVGAIWIAKTGNVKCTDLETAENVNDLFSIFEWEDTKKRYGEVCSTTHLFEED